MPPTVDVPSVYGSTATATATATTTSMIDEKHSDDNTIAIPAKAHRTLGNNPSRTTRDGDSGYLYNLTDGGTDGGTGNGGNDDDRVPLRSAEGGAGRGYIGGDLNGSPIQPSEGSGGGGGGDYPPPPANKDGVHGDGGGDGGDEPSGSENDDDDANSAGTDVPDTPLEHHLRVNVEYRRAIFTTIPIFLGYAAMITLQRSIKVRIGITDNDKERSDLFGVFVGNLYLGNLIFRLMHNVLFSFLIPRYRVMLSYTVLALAQLTIGLAYWVFDSKWLGWTFIAYLLAGVGIGTFESNLLSCLSPLGHATKSWAVIGIPIGFNTVAVGFYIVFAIEPHVTWLHAFPFFLIAGCCFLGLLFFIFFMPYVEYEASHDNVAKFKEDICRHGEWFPRVRIYCAALAGDMFCVSMFSAIVYYIYNLEDIPLWPYSETTIPKNVFQTIYNFFSFSGDFISRKIAYRDKHKRNPLYFLIFSMVGLACILSKVALLAPVGMFCVMFANGSIYAQTTKHVDNVVDDRFILIALSVWLFIGDIASYAASLIVQPLQLAIGKVPLHDHSAAAIVHNASNVTNVTTTIASMMMSSLVELNGNI